MAFSFMALCATPATAQVTERPGLKQYLLDAGAASIEKGGAYYLPTADLQVSPTRIRHADFIGAFTPAT